LKRIALATSSDLPEGTNDERLLKRCLCELGIDAFPVIWDDAHSNINGTQTIIIRSCWNYHRKPDEFLRWVARAESEEKQVLNPSRVIRWNINKNYLRRLQGTRIPETRWFNKGQTATLSDVLEQTGWSKAILKPAISATAWRTFVVTPELAVVLQSRFQQMLCDGDAIVQKFVDEVVEKGEWSFIFFHKQFSHCVIKRAKPGEFRVQNNFGGVAELVLNPPLRFVQEATSIVQSIPDDLLYARLDAVEISGEFYLMELELIEPQLFLMNEEIAMRFARAILNSTSCKAAKTQS
jgi:hypothetical protein